MRLLRDTNRVLLAKLVWKWLKNPKALWVRILKAKYSNILDENRVEVRRAMSMVGKGLRVDAQIMAKSLSFETNTRGRRQPRWQLSTKGVFTIKSAYGLMVEEVQVEERFPWKKP